MNIDPASLYLPTTLSPFDDTTLEESCQSFREAFHTKPFCGTLAISQYGTYIPTSRGPDSANLS